MARDRALLIETVREAGLLALAMRRTRLRTWTKGVSSPVSEADIAVNDLIASRLATLPDYGWLSEESADDLSRLGRRRVWIVDPIDGTRSFVARKPEFTICAALVIDGTPLAGAVFNPVTEEFFEAWKGGGARLNGQKIGVTRRRRLKGAELLASRRSFEHNDWLGHSPGAKFDHVNSIAYRMALVASGRYDATISMTAKSDWDLAAADIIVAEAGGSSTTSDGLPYRYNQSEPRHADVVCAGALHERLLELFRERSFNAGA